MAERKPVPYKPHAFKQYLFSAFRSFRSHKCRRAVVEYTAARKIYSYSRKKYRRRCRACNKDKIIRQKNVRYSIHHSVSSDDDSGKDLHTDKHTYHRTGNGGSQRIEHILEYYSTVFIAQRLERSDLRALFFDHSCHSGKAYERRYHNKEQREYHCDIAYSVCVLPVFAVSGVVLTGKKIPFRLFDIIKLLFVIIYLFLCIRKFFISLRLCVTELFYTVVIFLKTVFI